MVKPTGLTMIPLAAFLLCAFGAGPLAAPGDNCSLEISGDILSGFTPSCHGTCTPGGCQAPTKVEGSGVTRWWCDCNGVRGGEDAECESVLIYDSNEPGDPWVGRCYQGECTKTCVDFPVLPAQPTSMELCPCQ